MYWQLPDYSCIQTVNGSTLFVLISTRINFCALALATISRALIFAQHKLVEDFACIYFRAKEKTKYEV